MERLNRTSAPQAKTYTEKVIQFGEGNFLRAFVDWIIWKTNQKTDFNASVVLVQPIEKGMVDNLNEQDGLYHLNLQGIDEAGGEIFPPVFLYKIENKVRFQLCKPISHAVSSSV